MASLSLQDWLSLISTIAIVMALVFTGEQVREANRARDWAMRERTRTGNPKRFEWCEWLADRVGERRAARGHEPAHLKYREWR